MVKKFWLNEISFTWKVLVPMLIVVLSFFILTAAYTYSNTKKIQLQLLEKELSLEIQSIEKQFSNELFQKRLITERVGEKKEVGAYLQKVNARDTAKFYDLNKSVQKLLDDAKSNNSHIDRMWISDVDGEIAVGNSGLLAEDLIGIKKRYWFTLAKKNEGVFYTKPYQNERTKTRTISVIYPIIKNDKRLGYIGIDMALRNLLPTAKSSGITGENIVLFSSDGQILFDENRMWPLFKNEHIPLNVSSTVPINRGKYYVELRKVSNSDWEMGAYVQEEKVLAPLKDFQKRIIFFWFIAIVFLLVVIKAVMSYAMRDFNSVVDQLKYIEKGDFTKKINVHSRDEIGRIADAAEYMGQQLHKQMEILNFQASFDMLTKLPNRSSIERRIDVGIRHCRLRNEGMTVAFIDVDNFKEVNDTHGHAFGDELLIQVGQRVQTMLSKNKYLGRFGGDEFILLLKSNCEVATRRKLNDILQLFNEPFDLNGHDIYATASIGVARYPSDSITRSGLLAKADTALFEAKKQGRNRIEFFQGEMQESFEKKMRLEAGLRTALENNEFELFYQPQFNFSLGYMESAEALIRWNHPEWGMVSPDEFIPLAESSGHIRSIGAWVIDEGIKMAKMLKQHYPRLHHIGLNVSSVQLRERNFVEQVKTALAKYNIEPSLIELEITESVVIDRLEETIEKLSALKELGIALALDDFGTGYSSLNYLRRLPIDQVKLDRSFIQEMDEDPKKATMVHYIIEMAHSLGLRVVAEGVETEKQMQMLNTLQVDKVQGYFYSRPITQEGLFTFVDEKYGEIQL
ncbi:EAL domain-containing protein [Viridibacillus sp. NPDC096237]|uniref:EAL domain-containing protein n=1 Tax=Viridibacillus sp. NPDC096237 TaxID=3390721 RepID=UPI003D00C494